jgi:hypothetical protein
LAANPNPKSKLPNYWRQFIPDLCAGFANRCGYLAMWDLNGTVDHYLPVTRRRNLAYEWSNFRYVTGWVNSSKQAVMGRVLDPFRVRDDWFEIDLASLHLRLTAAVPARFRPRAAYTIRRLRLDYGPRVVRQRQTYLNFYRGGQLSLAQLQVQALLIAAAVRLEMLVTFLATNPPASTAQAAVVCGTTVAQIQPLLRAWVRAGHLQVQGRGRGVRYRI